MRYSLLTNIATLGLVGRIKKAPGTAGSFLAVLCAPLCFLPFSLPIRLLILSVLFLIGIKASEQAEKELKEKNIPLHEKMVESALKHIQILEELDFDLIKVSLKSSDVLTTIEAYRLMAEKCEYPLHLGVTEAGTLKNGLIKSSVGLGTLLSEGIGDTIRVSLTENPIEEVYAGYEILKSLKLRQRGVNFVSCPTCGRTQIDLIGLAKKVEERFKNLDSNITIATMGCAVNGPGEASHADFGIAGGIGEGYIFKKGEIIAKVPEEQLLENSYWNSLQTAVEHGIRTIAFPSISTGIYSYPVEQAALAAVRTVRKFCEEHKNKIDIVRFVLFDPKTHAAYERAVWETERNEY